jgi:hypothetical protein
VKRLVKMLNELIAKAEDQGLKLAPFIGIACPGVIDSDGAIEKGTQNLPRNWESSKFNLSGSLVKAIPQIGEHDRALGRVEDRRRSWQCPLYQSQQQGRALAEPSSKLPAAAAWAAAWLPFTSGYAGRQPQSRVAAQPTER